MLQEAEPAAGLDVSCDVCGGRRVHVRQPARLRRGPPVLRRLRLYHLQRPAARTGELLGESSTCLAIDVQVLAHKDSVSMLQLGITTS